MTDIRRALYPAYARLPAPLQGRARAAYRWLTGPNFSPKARWIRDVYSQHSATERRKLFLDIATFSHTNRPIDGYYFEFGSHEANTMRMAWDSFRYLFDWDFIAFDSFEGLPEIESIDKQEIWQKGKLATAEEDFIRLCVSHGMPRAKLRTVCGYYDQSLTDSLRNELLPKKAAVVYIDCDLYRSTVPVLKFIKDFLQTGTVIVFDDWNCFYGDPDRGERLAWREFREANPEFHFEDFVANGMQRSFIFCGPK